MERTSNPKRPNSKKPNPKDGISKRRISERLKVKNPKASWKKFLYNFANSSNFHDYEIAIILPFYIFFRLSPIRPFEYLAFWIWLFGFSFLGCGFLDLAFWDSVLLSLVSLSRTPSSHILNCWLLRIKLNIIWPSRINHFYTVEIYLSHVIMLYSWYFPIC